MSIYLPFISRAPRIAVIRLQGVIAPAGRGRLNDATLAPLIERAFRRRRPAAVALVINSPGGSPVQSSLIAARIRRLAGERKIPVHAFVEDVAAMNSSPATASSAASIRPGARNPCLIPSCRKNRQT